MWTNLPTDKKNEYKKMILAFASLTEMFAQKSNNNNNNENEEGEEGQNQLPAPVINSKYEETAFARVFGARIEDINNSSYDASLISEDHRHKYIIGIKTFGYKAGAQKIAQFKENSAEFAEAVNGIKENTLNNTGELLGLSKAEIDQRNHDLYQEIATRIAQLRNIRIRSSKENLNGFTVRLDDNTVESVYHVLMPSRAGEPLHIYVGETPYDEIDEGSISIDGCTSKKTPQNFKFHDGRHSYIFTTADNQLWMKFRNQQIVEETWDVVFAQNAYDIFASIAESVFGEHDAAAENETAAEEEAEEQEGTEATEEEPEEETAAEATEEEPEEETAAEEEPEEETESYVFPLIKEDGEPEMYSGLNSFYGVGSKLGRETREKRIEKIQTKFDGIIDDDVLTAIVRDVRTFLLARTGNNEQARNEKADLRADIIARARETQNQEFIEYLEKTLFRQAEEIYIPIPDSVRFHREHPNFFAPGAGQIKGPGNPDPNSLALPKEQRRFELMFEPSDDVLEAYIVQDGGKGIESWEKQSYLGQWILRGVFQLQAYEPLTARKMNDVHINAIRMYRTNGDDYVHLEFIWQ